METGEGVAEIRVQLHQATDTEKLPPVCIQSGRPATRIRRLVLPPDRPYTGSGCLSSLLFPVTSLVAWHNFRSMERPGEEQMHLPVYWWHRWVSPLRVVVQSVSKDAAVLGKVSDEFARNLKYGERKG